MKTISIVSAAFIMSLTSGMAVADNANVPKIYQRAPVIALPPGDPPSVEGAAWLIRSRNGIEGRVMTNVEAAGEAYTIWWVIFNHPEYCVDTPCGTGPDPLVDLLNPLIKVAIYSASGAISSDNGKGGGVINVDVRTVSGNYPESLHIFNLSDVGGPDVPFGDRLKRGNGFGAEVHLVVDSHLFDTDWVAELTQPEANHRAAIFMAPE